MLGDEARLVKKLLAQRHARELEVVPGLLPPAVGLGGAIRL